MMTTIENELNLICELLDQTTDETEIKIIESKIFELVEQLNGNTIYLTVQ